MNDFVVVLVLLAIFFVAVRVQKNRTRNRRARAATIELTADADGVRRRLADGREESARWSGVTSVEVVCTPVRTADGANAFALIADGADSGCLVPLGVGYDDDVFVELARLPGLRIQDVTAAMAHKPPKRTMVWTRAAPAT